jgi:hypothetical protein
MPKMTTSPVTVRSEITSTALQMLRRLTPSTSALVLAVARECLAKAGGKRPTDRALFSPAQRAARRAAQRTERRRAALALCHVPARSA